MHGTTELGGIIGNDASGGLVRGDALFVVCKTKAVVACSWCGGKTGRQMLSAPVSDTPYAPGVLVSADTV